MVHDLDKLHDVNRVEEVHAEDAPGVLRRFGDPRHAQRRSVGR